MATPLLDVQKFGQSIWYDNIRRGLITSGELASTKGRTSWTRPCPPVSC